MGGGAVGGWGWRGGWRIRRRGRRRLSRIRFATFALLLVYVGLAEVGRVWGRVRLRLVVILVGGDLCVPGFSLDVSVEAMDVFAMFSS